MQPPEITANPWIGVDRGALAWLRARVDGLGRFGVPDAPAAIAGQGSAFFDQLADGVTEGYAATYTSQAGDLGVHAVRYAPDIAPRTILSDGARAGRIRRFETGSVRAVLYGDHGSCGEANAAHLQSLFTTN
jgi:hypothetical protein